VSLTLRVGGAAQTPLPRAAPRLRRLERWFTHYPQVSAGVVIVLALVLLTLAAPLVGRYDPTTMDTTAPLNGPSLSHFFGTDNFGRDVYSRTLYGYRASLTAAVGSVIIAVLIGLPFGLFAGYFGSLTDNLIMRTMDVLLAFPAVLWVIALVGVLGTNTEVLALAIGVIYVPIIARVMRSATLALKGVNFVDSARALGASEASIVLRHVLPNAISPVIIQASILMGIAILIEAALSFIGLGTQPPDPSLGLMLSDGRGIMQEAPWVVIFPGLAIVAAVLGFNLLGDGLRDVLDPRLRSR
jgi:peptide/nickel transport system permease protein